MKVNEVVQILSQKDGEEEIIVAWWEAQDFGLSPKSQPWLNTVSWADNLDWSRISQDIQDELNSQADMKEITINFSGIKYNFQILVWCEPKCCLEVQAFSKLEDIMSTVTNVNRIADSLFWSFDSNDGHYSTNNPDYADTTWICSSFEEATQFVKNLLNDLLNPSALIEIEAALDEDRTNGEWASMLPDRREGK